jgi:alpha-beta hydrolase superfamily lysophospholipase
VTPGPRIEVLAARTAPAPGVEHAVGFLAGAGGELFVSVHSPSRGAQASLVLCPPLLADHPFSYRREVLLAVELARRGVAVWRFHYAGTGYSQGSTRGVSFDTMVGDAAQVVDAAASAADAPVTVGGTRCGAMVAAAAGRDHPLVFWEPVPDGSAYIREGFRARMIADGGQLQRRPPTGGELLEELRREGRIELLGYSLYEPMHDTVVGCRLVDLVDAGQRRLLIIDSLTPDGAQPAGTLAQQLRDLGASVTTATAGIAEGWWFHRTQQSDPAPVASELAGLIEPWLPRSTKAVAVTVPPSTGERVCDFIRFGDDAVFGLLTPPREAPRGEAALILWGGGGMPAFGRNQVAMALTRRLADRGFHVLQIDHPGRGDSPGPEPADPIDEPSKQAVFAAARAAYEWLRSRGMYRVLTIGSCQGAVAAVNTADAAAALTGLVLLAPPIAERFEGGGTTDEPCDAISPLHPRMRRSFGEIVRTGTPLLIAYGVEDEGFQSFEAAMQGELGTMLGRADDRFTVVLTEERIHGYMTVSGQEATVDIVMDWLERRAS